MGTIDLEELKRKVRGAERELLSKALRVFEHSDDNQKGLNRTEFDALIRALPKRYRKRLERSQRDFDSFDVQNAHGQLGSDGILMSSELSALLDEMVKREVDEGVNAPGLEN